MKQDWSRLLIGHNKGDRIHYRQGNAMHWLGVRLGMSHGSGADYSSLIEWKGRKGSILRHLKNCNCEWFSEFLEKGIREEDFSETDVIEAFAERNGFSPPRIEFERKNHIDDSNKECEAIRQFEANPEVINRAQPR